MGILNNEEYDRLPEELESQNEDMENKVLSTVRFYDQLAFFTNGMVNNFVYVVFLSAAADIVGVNLPKAVVLLANIVPTFLVKLLLPYYMHKIPYRVRIILVVLSAIFSLLCVALSQSLHIQLLGILVSSAGSGLGEITFLALASFYNYDVVTYWSSGTGAAGVTGSLAYLALSTWIGLSSRATMLVCSVIPLLMLLSFFGWMSHPYLDVEKKRISYSESSNTGADEIGPTTPISPRFSCEEGSSTDPVLYYTSDQLIKKSVTKDSIRPEDLPLKERIRIVKTLIIPYMLPLLIVFWAEYTINQGVSPVLLFPLDETPFLELREHYVYYQFVYQVGVLASRSSGSVFPIEQLYLLDLAQCTTLFILLFQATLQFHSSIYLTLLVTLWVGLFGGAAYANAFRKINSELPENLREFAMGVASVADTLGITLAAFTAYFLEPALCNYQVKQGVTLCKALSGA